MKWYYAKPGNIENRGFVEIDELEAMARDGRLLADDLVRGEKSKKWVRASVVSGLIPRPQADSDAEDRENPASPENTGMAPVKERRHSFRGGFSRRSVSEAHGEKKQGTGAASNGEVRKRIREDISKGKARSVHYAGSWILFIVLGAVTGFLRYGNILHADTLAFMQTYGPYLILTFHVVIVLKAFTDSIFEGILCLLIPLYSAYYLFAVSDAFYMRAVLGGLLVGSAQDTAMFLYEQLNFMARQVNDFIQVRRSSVR